MAESFKIAVHVVEVMVGILTAVLFLAYWQCKDMGYLILAVICGLSVLLSFCFQLWWLLFVSLLLAVVVFFLGSGGGQ
ncbi:MAG: hypothetical protein PHR77_04680 [Kiritimatiellae bacterium]|nr:hypothetical protein [Kiritimatiellia bacterium]MDD5519477.1 hypothetical protein [Kiritimatiellia bacterium]